MRHLQENEEVLSKLVYEKPEVVVYEMEIECVVLQSSVRGEKGFSIQDVEDGGSAF